jgi:hypothetical protein
LLERIIMVTKAAIIAALVGAVRGGMVGDGKSLVFGVQSERLVLMGAGV